MKQMNRRIFILRLAASLIVTALIYNLFQIQIIEGEQWADIADNNRFRHLVEIAPRGRIFSADGVELAGNVPGYEVALAFEPDTQKRQQAVDKLAELLAMSREEIEEKLSKHYRRFEPATIASNVDFQTVLMLEEHRHLIPGLVIQIKPRRIYPETTLFAHTLGHLKEGNIGASGLELQWEEYLRGKTASASFRSMPMAAP